MIEFILVHTGSFLIIISLLQPNSRKHRLHHSYSRSSNHLRDFSHVFFLPKVRLFFTLLTVHYAHVEKVFSFFCWLLAIAWYRSFGWRGRGVHRGTVFARSNDSTLIGLSVFGPDVRSNAIGRDYVFCHEGVLWSVLRQSLWWVKKRMILDWTLRSEFADSVIHILFLRTNIRLRKVYGWSASYKKF